MTIEQSHVEFELRINLKNQEEYEHKTQEQMLSFMFQINKMIHCRNETILLFMFILEQSSTGC